VITGDVRDRDEEAVDNEFVTAEGFMAMWRLGARAAFALRSVVCSVSLSSSRVRLLLVRFASARQLALFVAMGTGP
jgi:hypothetical protein